MDNEQARRLTAAEARDRASQCREMARRALNPEHRLMLEEMAEMWGRLAMNLGDAVEPTRS